MVPPWDEGGDVSSRYRRAKNSLFSFEKLIVF
jgi:hypothetical protein